MPKLVIEKEDLYKLAIGEKIWFSEERCGYTIQAKGGQYLICTKPFNPKHTVLYTIVDIENMMRGPEDLVFGMGAETRQACEEMLHRLRIGESDLSHRHSIPLCVWNL
jgi:hypothetical protein